MARERLRLDLPLSCNERLTTSPGTVRQTSALSEQASPPVGQAARRGSQAALVHGSENGRNEVSSNGGKQLIPPDGVWD
jgi:hypothetical protein